MDLNVMIREQAVTGLQAQLDAAVTEGDTVKARKLADDLANLKAATAPKAPPYSDADIKSALEKKAEWFGIDPRKSGAAVRLGKDMNPAKFATADLFADALIKAVGEEFKPATAAAKPGEEDDEEGDEEGDKDGEGEDTEDPPAKPKPRKTDGPSDLERGTAQRASKGPWAKLSDAPTAVAADIRRQADKMVSKSVSKEQREGFISRALASAYRRQQNSKGK